jgi:hypothetical protein
MYKSEKDKLKALLEDWWLRFTYVRWSNFGRAEAELAIRILDRWAGPRLWSWKRWRFSTNVTVGVFVLVVLWTLLRAAFLPAWSEVGWINLRAVVILPPIAVAFALSLSVTRVVAARAVQLPTRPLFNVLAFILLLVIHLTLLVYWSEVVLILELLPLSTLDTLKQVFDPSRHEELGSVLLKAMNSLFEVARLQHSESKGGWVQWPNWSVLFGFELGNFTPNGAILMGLKFSMDFVANGLRIVFALVFLSSFVFRPLIQVPVTRLWYGAMNSSKGTFTLLFGAVGTLVAAGQVLAR